MHLHPNIFTTKKYYKRELNKKMLLISEAFFINHFGLAKVFLQLGHFDSFNGTSQSGQYNHN
jgi:hypothetical protein